MLQTSPTPDFKALKIKQQAAWSTGNYAVIGTTVQIVGESLCEAIDICAGERVLDVAAGNGNATLAAARRFADVTSTDYVPQLLDQAEKRANAEGLKVAFHAADAEALPFADGSFDVVLSTFGVMFAPDHERAASELSRMVQKGGRIGLASWTPDSFIGRLFKTLGKHLPPPAGVRSPSQWGSLPYLQELFPKHKIMAAEKIFNFRYKSAAHWLEVFKTYYGPLNRAFAAVSATNGANALEADILELIQSCARSNSKTLIVPSAYLEAVITK